jgi:hypothetical protein
MEPDCGITMRYASEDTIPPALLNQDELQQLQLLQDSNYPFTLQQQVDPTLLIGQPQFPDGLPSSNSYETFPGNEVTPGQEIPMQNPPEPQSQGYGGGATKKKRPAEKSKKKRQSRKKPLNEEEDQQKRQLFLQRNRDAAMKCRQRKGEWTKKLQATAAESSQRYQANKFEVTQLTEELIQLVNSVENHGNCGITKIDEWLANDSERVVTLCRETSMSQHASGQSHGSAYGMGYGGSQAMDMAMNFHQPAPISRNNSGQSYTHASHMSEASIMLGPVLQDRTTTNQQPKKYRKAQAVRDEPSLTSQRMTRQNSRTQQMLREDSSASNASGVSGQHDSGFSSMGTPSPDKVKDSSSPIFQNRQVVPVGLADPEP